MLPELYPHQGVFVEISNIAHGGIGWEYGRCLWSPVYNRKRAMAWKIMLEPQIGDLVIHLAKYTDGYHWEGISRVKIQCNQFEETPPEAGPWKEMSPYQRIGLEQYQQIDFPPHINLLFEQFEMKFREEVRNKSNFYVEYGNSRKLQMAQKYLAILPYSLYKCFDQYSNQIDFSPTFSRELIIPTNNEIVNPDFEAPGRVDTIVSRIIRDTQLVRSLKSEYDFTCQICGYKLSLPNGNFYCEGHHLKPLGGTHAGPDIKENIIILCPTHHAEFDYGAIAIDPTNNLVVHIDSKNTFNGTPLEYHRKDLLKTYLEFHWEERFNKF